MYSFVRLLDGCWMVCAHSPKSERRIQQLKRWKIYIWLQNSERLLSDDGQPVFERFSVKYFNAETQDLHQSSSPKSSLKELMSVMG